MLREDQAYLCNLTFSLEKLVNSTVITNEYRRMKKCTDQDVHNNAYLLYYILDRFCYNLKGIVVSSKHRNTWWKLVSYTYVQNKMEAHGTYKIFQ